MHNLDPAERICISSGQQPPSIFSQLLQLDWMQIMGVNVPLRAGSEFVSWIQLASKTPLGASQAHLVKLWLLIFGWSWLWIQAPAMKLGAETMVCHLVHPTSNQVFELISFAVAEQVPVVKLKTKPHCFENSLVWEQLSSLNHRLQLKNDGVRVRRLIDWL